MVLSSKSFSPIQSTPLNGRSTPKNIHKNDYADGIDEMSGEDNSSPIIGLSPITHKEETSITSPKRRLTENATIYDYVRVAKKGSFREIVKNWMEIYRKNKFQAVSELVDFIIKVSKWTS